MSERLTGSFQLMKQMNTSLILDIIRQQGPISRAEIAKQTKLTPPTVTNIVRVLLKSGIVVEGQPRESTGGRKAISLQINPRAYFVLGVDVGVSKVTVVVSDLEATIIAQRTRSLINIPGHQVITIMTETIKQVITISGITMDRFLGLGLGMHGLVDAKSGILLFAPNFNLRHIMLKDILEERFGIPAWIDNDVRAMALGESWFGNGRGTQNFIFLNVGMGIGAGIVFNREVYHGVSQSAGEIGHTTVVEEGPLCNCGNRGCLEVLAAGPAIARRAIEAMEQGNQSSLMEAGLSVKELTALDVYLKARNGDPLCLNLMKETGKYLGIAIANMLNLLNPEKVIIGGGVSKAGELLLAPLKETVSKRALEVPLSVAQIELSSLGNQAGAIGATVLVLRNLFSIPQIGSNVSSSFNT